MLHRAASQIVRTHAFQLSHARQGRPVTLALRSYAGSSKPPRSPPPPPSYNASRAAPSPNQRPPNRQTSPGTQVPKATGAGAKKGVQSPVLGSRPTGAVGKTQTPLQGSATEPIAQRADLDAPPARGIRDETHSQQATSENTTPPPEPPSHPEPAQPQKPLPDLRQGIPSTFDLEFGQGKRGAGSDTGASGKSDPKSFDITEREAEPSGRRGGEEEQDYRRADHQTSVDRQRARIGRWFNLAIAANIVLATLYLARPFDESEKTPPSLASSDTTGWSPSRMYNRVRARIGDQLGYYTEPSFPKLLPTVPEGQRHPFTLVISLEDLLVHSTWDRANGYRMAKRPGVDYFIRYLSQYYELVLFTSVPISIADPVIRKLDPYHFIMWPLGREATKYENGEYVKDLSYLNRDLKKTLIVDTRAGHVKNQPENAIVLPKWSGNPQDSHTNDLVALIPFLEYVATMGTEDVRTVMQSFEGKDIPTEFARREALAREKFNKELAEQRHKRPSRSIGSALGGLGIKADRTGGMTLLDGQSVAEGLAKGKMLSDQIREQGQRYYEHIEKQIQEQGAQWLKDEEDEQKKMMEAQMQEMKKNPAKILGFFGGGGSTPPSAGDSKA